MSTVSEVDYIRTRLIHIYSVPQIEEWLSSPQPLLSGEVPYELIHRGEAGRVIVAVGQLLDMVYV